MQTEIEENLEADNPYYGFFKSLGIGILIFFIFSIVQTVLLFAYIFATQDIHADNLKETLTALTLNGNAIAIAEIPSAIFGVWLVIYFAGKRKIISATAYLKIYSPVFTDTLKWLGIMVLVIIAMQGLNTVFERETPDFMNQVYNGSNHLLLGIAVVIGAPFFEEFLFRGFIFEGLLHSRIGLIGALIIPAAIWAVIHVQYGLFEIATIFIIGIILAIAKYQTQSIYIPIFMHMFMNLTASIFMEFSDSLQ